jgi:hypothetical protein
MVIAILLEYIERQHDNPCFASYIKKLVKDEQEVDMISLEDVL